MAQVAGMAEAAELVGVSKSNFSAHRKKFNGEGECPPETAHLASGPVWVGKDYVLLEKWGRAFAKVRVTKTRKPKEAAAPAPAAKKAPAKAAVAKKVAAPKAAPVKKTATKAASAPAKKGMFAKKTAA